MQKLILSIILILFLLSTVMAGCGQSTPASTGKQVPTTTTSQPTILKLSNYGAGTGIAQKAYNAVIKTITDRSQGRVKFESYDNGSLIPATEEVPSVSKGVADIAFVNSNNQARLTLMNVLQLPGIGGTMQKQGINAAQIAKMPGVQAQFDQSGVRMLGVIGGSGSLLWFTKEIKSIDGLAGRKLRVTGDPALVISKFGAVCISMPGPDMTEAFQRGTLDGSLGDFAGAISQGHHKLCRWIIDYPVATGFNYLIMNSSSYNKLPDDIKKIFDEEWAKLPQVYVDLFSQFDKEVRTKTLPEAGVTLVQITPAETAKIVEYSRPIADAWIAAREKEGLATARDVLSKILELNGAK